MSIACTGDQRLVRVWSRDLHDLSVEDSRVVFNETSYHSCPHKSPRWRLSNYGRWSSDDQAWSAGRKNRNMNGSNAFVLYKCMSVAPRPHWRQFQKKMLLQQLLCWLDAALMKSLFWDLLRGCLWSIGARVIADRNVHFGEDLQDFFRTMRPHIWMIL